MATMSGDRPRKINLAPNRIDHFLAAASIALLAFVIAAIVRGRPEWSDVPAISGATLQQSSRRSR